MSQEMSNTICPSHGFVALGAHALQMLCPPTSSVMRSIVTRRRGRRFGLEKVGDYTAGDLVHSNGVMPSVAAPATLKEPGGRPRGRPAHHQCQI